MNYTRMVIEKEAPEEYGYDRIRCNLSESSIADQKLSDIGLNAAGSYAFLRRASRRRAIASTDRRGGCRASRRMMCWSPPVPPARCSSSRPRFCPSRPPRRRAAQLCHQYRDAQGNRLWHQLYRSGVRGRLRHRRRARRSGDAAEHALVSVTCPHNPTGTMMTAGRPRRAGGARRKPAMPSAGRRDLSRPQLWPAAAGRRFAQPAGDQRFVAVEGVRHPRHTDRLACHPGPRALREIPGRQGADRHLRQRHRRGHRAQHAGGAGAISWRRCSPK